MSRIPTHLPPPSFHGWFFRFPATDLQNQYRPVYYASGITKTHFRQLQQAHRGRIQRCRATIEQQRAAALATKAALVNATTTTATATSSSTAAAGNSTASQLVDAAVRLAALGLPSDSSPLFLTLHQAQRLSGNDYARYIAALAAPDVFAHLHGGEANFDRAVTYKMMGDYGGSARANEAVSAFELACAALSAPPSNVAARRTVDTAAVTRQRQLLLHNALMQTLLSCGYDNVRRVSGDVYDSIGVAGLAPTSATYRHVMTSLCLLANPDEANHVLTFLRAKCAAELDTGMFNTLMLGYREARAFDRVDELWAEMVDSRCPAPDVGSAEEVLRSIVELGNTPLSQQNLQMRGQTNVVERKRIPLVLHQMEQLGVLRAQLCPPVLHEVECALRQFSIYRSRFYEWGRAVKLFNFVDYRRKHGWLYDLPDISIPLSSAPQLRPYGSDVTSATAPFATETAPAHLAERPSWEQQPLAALFNRITTEEYNEDSRGGSEKYQTVHRPIHQRDPAWRSKVPQTRYDTLYGVSTPSMPTVGVRRHLSGTESAALGTDDAVAQKDASIVRRSLSKARRARITVERARTHRVSAADSS